MQTTTIVEAGVLEDKTTKITMSGNNVVSLFLLSEFVTIVLTYFFSCLTDKAGGNQTTMHSRE